LTAPVSVTRQEGILRVTIDNPPLNAINAAVRQGLWDALDRAETERDLVAVVLDAAGTTFSAGGDLKEVGRPDPPGSITLTALNDRIEAFPKPVVVAIQGRAFGGGVLLALACHGRVADAAARLMLPEVRLGFVPGAGGTQRLPRLCGQVPALDMAVLAEPMPAVTASDNGLVDVLAQGDHLPAAIAMARDIAAGRRPWRRTGRLAVPPSAEPPAALAARYRARAEELFPGREAPLAAIALVTGAALWPFAEGCGRERTEYLALSTGPQARALLHLFFAERALRLPEGRPEGEGACRLLRHAGRRLAELLASPDAPPAAIAEAAAEARHDRLLAVPVRGPVVDRLRAAMTGLPAGEAALAACRRAAFACEREGLADSDAIDLLAVEICDYPAQFGGPLHHARSATTSA